MENLAQTSKTKECNDDHKVTVEESEQDRKINIRNVDQGCNRGGMTGLRGGG